MSIFDGNNADIDREIHRYHENRMQITVSSCINFLIFAVLYGLSALFLGYSDHVNLRSNDNENTDLFRLLVANYKYELEFPTL